MGAEAPGTGGKALRVAQAGLRRGGLPPPSWFPRPPRPHSDDRRLIHRHEDGTEEWMAFFEDNEGRPLALMTQVRDEVR